MFVDFRFVSQLRIHVGSINFSKNGAPQRDPPAVVTSSFALLCCAPESPGNAWTTPSTHPRFVEMVCKDFFPTNLLFKIFIQNKNMIQNITHQKNRNLPTIFVEFPHVHTFRCPHRHWGVLQAASKILHLGPEVVIRMLLMSLKQLKPTWFRRSIKSGIPFKSNKNSKAKPESNVWLWLHCL